MKLERKLRNALNVIADECAKHSTCYKCPLFIGDSCQVTAGSPKLYLRQILYYAKYEEDGE